MSILEKEFNDKVSDATAAYYVRTIASGTSLPSDNEEFDIISDLLFHSNPGANVFLYMEDRHYDMKTAEEMLSTLSCSVLGGNEMNEMNEIDFSIYYDDKINLILLSEDDIKVSYIANVVTKRDNDYAEDITNFITSKYMGDALDDDGEEVMLTNFGRMFSIINDAETSDSLISHLIIFRILSEDNQFIVVEISPFGTDIVNGQIYPLDIGHDGHITLTNEVKKNDPLATLSKMTQIELFYKICEFSSSFKSHIGNSILQSSEEVDLFMKEYLPPIVAADTHALWSRELLFSEKYHDVTIETSDGEKIYAHKLILSRFSKFFETFFYGAFGRTKNTVAVNVASKQMREILTYIYAGVVNFHEVESIPELITAAEYFQVDDLIKFFVKELY